MADIFKRKVVVGHHDSKQRELIKEVLASDFNASVCDPDDPCNTFDALLGCFKKRKREPGLVAAVFSHALIEDNRYERTDESCPVIYAGRLNYESNRAKLVCVYSGSAPMCFQGPTDAPLSKPEGTLIEVNPMWPDHMQRSALVDGFTKNKILDPVPPPPETVFDRTDLALVEQIRSLDPDRCLEAGLRVLGRLVIRFFDCERVNLDKLSQGFSGATVFLIEPKKRGLQFGEYALKLCPKSDQWKIEHEVRGQAMARAKLGVQGVTKHIPDLIEPMSGRELGEAELRRVASYGNWVAVCYDFLGGKRFGKFIDLETALTTKPADLAKRIRGTYLARKLSEIDTARHSALATVLHWLGSNWYLNKDETGRKIACLWRTTDARAKEYEALPPYALTGQMKRLILSFLDGQGEALGQRLLNDTWKEHRRAIWKLLGRDRGSTGFAKLDRELPVLLSPCHGDMNSNNVLLWLELRDYPFLIDFPYFQERGHALQDLARLEVETKLSLMDRQRVDSPQDLKAPGPRAYDHTYTQLVPWKELENYVLAEPVPAHAKTWPTGTEKQNLDLTLMLIHDIRKMAKKVQQQTKNGYKAPPFFDEYFPPLLYYTLRSIGYPSLPVFKRLLAVYSAGRILETLRDL